jgi:hypothetical protein
MPQKKNESHDSYFNMVFFSKFFTRRTTHVLLSSRAGAQVPSDHARSSTGAHLQAAVIAHRISSSALAYDDAVKR